MERFVITLDSAAKFQVIRQALAMAEAIDGLPPEFSQHHQLPVLTTDYRPAYLENQFRGRSAFLACSGPSLLDLDLTQLDQRGILTMAVNNAATVFRPHLWCCADPPYRFSRAIWEDPGIMKFLPIEQITEDVEFANRSDGDQAASNPVSEMPNVYGYIRNLKFKPQSWLHEPTINYGQNEGDADAQGHEGVRSVLLVALKLLYFIGIRRVYLIGCDFKMEAGGKNYAFDQKTTSKYVGGNNSSYAVLNDRLYQLQPSFLANAFQVINCTPESGLTAFPYVNFEEAVKESVIPNDSIPATEGYSKLRECDPYELPEIMKSTK